MDVGPERWMLGPGPCILGDCFKVLKIAFSAVGLECFREQASAELLPLERPRAKLFFRAKGAHALSLRVTSLLSVGSGAPCSREMAADDDLEVLDDWLDDTVPQEPWQPEFPADQGCHRV